MTRALFSLAVCSLLLNTPAFAQVEVVAKYRARYGTPMAKAEIVALLTDVARELNQQQPIFGILRKPAGNNCLGYSCDIICTVEQPMRQFDVLGDLPDVGSPAWNQVKPEDVNPQGGCEYVPPYITPVPNPGTPVPNPGTPCPECPPDQREEVARLQADVLSLLAERDALLNRPPPRCEARLWGFIKVPCRVIQPVRPSLPPVENPELVEVYRRIDAQKAMLELHAEILKQQSVVLESVATRLGLLVDRLKQPSLSKWGHAHPAVEKIFP